MVYVPHVPVYTQELNKLLDTVNEVTQDSISLWHQTLAKEVQSSFAKIEQLTVAANQTAFVQEMVQVFDQQERDILETLELPLKSLEQLVGSSHLDESQKTLPSQLVRSRQVEIVENRRHEVDVLRGSADPSSSLPTGREPDDERHLEHFRVKGKTMGPGTVLVELLTVVGRHDEQGVFVPSALLQRIQESPEFAIVIGDLGIVEGE